MVFLLIFLEQTSEIPVYSYSISANILIAKDLRCGEYIFYTQ